MIELTDVSAVVPALEVADWGPTVILTAAREVTPEQFLEAVERVRQDFPDAAVGWEYSGSAKPVLKYEDGGVNVRIVGPDMPDRKVEPPDAEQTLRKVAANGE